MTSTSTSTGEAQSSGLDTAKLLVQRVARQFYGVKGAILADQLIKKEVFRDEEIAKRLGMQSKDIAKIAHRLVEDQIIQVHRRSEMRDNGMAKAQLRTYYFLDYSKATDAIKWRMWKVQQTIDVKLRNELDAQGYICPLCKASYTHLDAAALFDPYRNLLACSVCQTEVTNLENEEEVKGNKDRMQRLNRQTKSVVDLLKGLEKAEVPRFDVERWLAIHGPSLGATALLAAEAAGTLPAAQTTVTVQIAGDDDEALELAKKEEDLLRKREQNALPSWIALSTIKAGEQEGAAKAGGGGQQDRSFSSAVPGVGASMSLHDGDSKPLLSAAQTADDNGGADEASLDAYYASLATLDAGTPFSAGRESATPALEGTPFDAFSPSGGFSASATPALDEIDPVAGGSGKRSREDSSFSTYSASGLGPASGAGAESKRGRFDSPSVPPAASVPPVEAAAAAEEEDDEEEWDEEGGEGAGGGADPNQLISVNGEMKPFGEVTEEMTGEMTADEYSAYWDVYQQING